LFLKRFSSLQRQKSFVDSIGPRLKTAASQRFVRSLGFCGHDMLAASLSAPDPNQTSAIEDFGS
jgi:hypothetical protein